MKTQKYLNEIFEKLQPMYTDVYIGDFINNIEGYNINKLKQTQIRGEWSDYQFYIYELRNEEFVSIILFIRCVNDYVDQIEVLSEIYR